MKKGLRMRSESSIAPRRRRSSLETRERRQALGFITPAVLGLAVFTVLPVGLAIVMSLFDWPIFGKRTFVGFDNYVKLLTSSPDFWPALRNTAVFTLLYVPLNLIVALGLSLLLGPRIRGRAVFRVLFFIPVVTPIVASALIWRLVLQPDGLLNGMSTSLFGWELPNFLVDQNWAMLAVVAMSVWAGMGYNMLVLTAALEQVPTSVVEAAQIDGARGIRLVWQVIIPLISPAIFFAAVMTIISSMQVFAQPQLLTGGGPGTSTVPLVMFIYNTGFKFQDLGLAAAGAWLLFVIIIGITALQFRAQKRWVHYEH
ncbi:multiple sugar transport system permease protein [Microbacterium trichothecenolyticum]|uniref:Multiple sugar transport system permease protein n=2 Tax=Microbacterium trichothecenolyticum TaxID=69370 RepID=A0ABU0TW43_MICTR|nr:multiple sugar transport system permease protein [Microbacterium trichothecenolyticum]